MNKIIFARETPTPPSRGRGRPPPEEIAFLSAGAGLTHDAGARGLTPRHTQYYNLRFPVYRAIEGAKVATQKPPTAAM
ncbi:unnamed protein product [Leptosia nina]|uniref:Uncharacterized protein n=1 Tax=Leptosia nina TaxID=320188 RepID=A0AAV1K2Y6_9NEOP